METGLPRHIGHWLDFNSEGILRVSSVGEMSHQFFCSLLQVLFLRANCSESECLTVGNGCLTVSAVSAFDGGLVGICRLHVQVCLYVLVLQVHSSIQKCLFCGPGHSEFDGHVVTVQVRQELPQRWFTTCPDGKYVIYVPPPYQGWLVLGQEELPLQLPHKEVGIRRCHSGTHGCYVLL